MEETPRPFLGVLLMLSLVYYIPLQTDNSKVENNTYLTIDLIQLWKQISNIT